MKEFAFSNVVRAPKDEIFKIMLDLKKYNSWNTCLHYRSGKMEAKNSLVLEASLDGKKFIKWSCKVEEIKTDRFILSKTLISKYYMNIKHHFIVSELDNSTCEVEHKWVATGISPRFFWSKITKVLEKFRPYNESLKKYIESNNELK